jgi:heme-degrading monooxygenase HmoA
VIARLWHGWTTPDKADEYQELLEREVLPGIEAKTRGYEGVYVLRRDAGDEVEFVTLTLWESLDAVRTLVGDDYETAYVPAEARRVLARFDDRSVHYELVLKA